MSLVGHAADSACCVVWPWTCAVCPPCLLPWCATLLNTPWCARCAECLRCAHSVRHQWYAHPAQVQPPLVSFPTSLHSSAQQWPVSAGPAVHFPSSLPAAHMLGLGKQITPARPQPASLEAQLAMHHFPSNPATQADGQMAAVYEEASGGGGKDSSNVDMERARWRQMQQQVNGWGG